jgi:hypothetical protein
MPDMNETMTLTENPGIVRRGTVRLTTAQALVRYLSNLRTRVTGQEGDEIVPLFGGVFAIFWPRQRGWDGGGPLSVSRPVADLPRP